MTSIRVGGSIDAGFITAAHLGQDFPGLAPHKLKLFAGDQLRRDHEGLKDLQAHDHVKEKRNEMN